MDYRRPADRDAARGPQFWGFLLMSVSIHLAVLGIIGELIDLWPRVPVRRYQVTLWHPPALEGAVEARRKKKTPPRPQQPAEESKPDELTRQVVNLPPSQDQTPPEDARYQSQHNTRAERETRSRHRRLDYRNAMNERSRQHPIKALKSPLSADTPAAINPAADMAVVGGASPEQPVPTPVPTEAQSSASGDAAVFETPKRRGQNSLTLALDPELGDFFNRIASERADGNSEHLRVAIGNHLGATDAVLSPGSGASATGSAANLVPDFGVKAMVSGDPAADYLDDVEDGEGTYLNSREFKYASFFNRVHQGVSRSWHPGAIYRERDPHGNVYGRSDRITVLSVTLDQDGTLDAIGVKDSSGVGFLDREAMRAFRSAQPFPNPPRGLLDASNRISFNFGFHLMLSGSGIAPPDLRRY